MERTEKKENWYDRFRSFCMIRMVPSKELEEDGIIYWRAYILFSILFVVFVSGLVTLIPAFFLVIKNNLWGLGIFDLGAWLIVIMLLLAINISFYIRSAFVLILTYLLGLVIIVNVGILSGGPLCLFSFAVFAGIFRGKKAVVSALAFNAITLSIISWLFYTNQFGQTFPSLPTAKRWRKKS